MNLQVALVPLLLGLGERATAKPSSSSSSSSSRDVSSSSASSINDDPYGSKKKRDTMQQRKKLRQLHDPSPSSELTNRQDHPINGDGSTGSDASKKQDIGYLDHRRIPEDPRSDETFQRHRELESREDYCKDLCPSERPEIQDNAFKSLITSDNDASIGCWNTSAVTDMKSAFAGNNDFNEKINCWDVSNVTTMYRMFWFGKKFNQPLDDWNVARVNDMGEMFNSASDFNQPISNWNVAKVTSMGDMFYSAQDFNQPVDDWDVARVTDMGEMFYYSESFNQCITSWAGKTPSTVATGGMLGNTDCPISSSSPNPNVGPWCRNFDCPTSAPTSSPTLSLAPTSAPTTTPTERSTGSPTPPEACVNSAEFDCDKHSVGFKKRKCSKKIRKKWGVGLKFRDVCSQMCLGQLCTCVDRVEKFSIKGVEGDHTCAGLIGRTNCKKFSDIYGFAVNKICPNKCKNTKKCINAP